MRVSPVQLMTGCLVTKDVMGRTNRPIIPKNTTLQPLHIDVLKKFSVEAVEVSNKKSDESTFRRNATRARTQPPLRIEPQ